MSISLTWLGHAAFALNVNGTKLLIDPFLSDNPVAQVGPDEVEADYILISHGHGDHIGDAVEIARRTNALVITNFEICNWFHKQGYENTHAQHIGGSFQYPFGRVKLTLALHGSGLPDGSDGGLPCGFLITADNKRIYISGDTGVFSDMSLIGREGLNLATLPIGDNYTMGPDDALLAVEFLQPKVVIPIHYDTWELIQQDAQAWANRVAEETEAEVVVLEVGGTYEL